LAHYLQQPKGRLLQLTCDADLGDGRCGVDINTAALKGTATITAAHSARRFTVSGLSAFGHDFFTRGLVTFTSGPASGLKIEVKTHVKAASLVTIELWADAEGPPVAGNTFDVTAGCDKRFETCKAKFSNQINFRGFPAMPGNDYLTKIGRKTT
jgi:uncharacterized phage protein (TIGR02218 family)